MDILNAVVEYVTQYMWFAMGGVGALALILGWIFGAVGGGGKVKRANGERDMALSELEQAKVQIDELFAAKKRLEGGEAGSIDAKIEAEIASRESMIKSLGDDLANARSEIEQLKQKTASAAGGPPENEGVVVTGRMGNAVPNRPVQSMAALGGSAPTVVSAVTGGPAPANSAPQANPAQPASAPAPQSTQTAKPNGAATDTSPETSQLIWRNRYLESRLRVLEQQLVDQDARAEDVVAAPVEDTASDTPDTDVAKLKWQNTYLQQRIAKLEEQVVGLEAPAGADSAELEEADEEPAVTPDSELDQSGVEQELARLRWRTRFLEGRLAYLAGDSADAVEAEIVEEAEELEAADEENDEFSVEADQADEVPEETVELSAEPIEEQPVEEDPESEPVDEPEEVSAEGADESEALDDIIADINEADGEGEAAASVEAAEDEPTLEPAADEEAVLSPSSHIAPVFVSHPENGGDDLMKIEGVGPRINEALRELGVYSFEQIAAWTPENCGWINHRLGFQGRVERENWVSQAQALQSGEQAQDAPE